MSETKVCTQCQQEKVLKSFSWKTNKKKKRRSICKTCHAVYRRQHYLDNQKKYKKMANEWNAEHYQTYVDRARRYVYDYLKEHPCVDCGESDPVVLEFDHVGGEKVSAISEMVRVVNLDKLQTEIDKCEVRCVNCHRIKTAKENNWKILDLLKEYGYTFD